MMDVPDYDHVTEKQLFDPRLGSRRVVGSVVAVTCSVLSLAAVVVLALLLISVFVEAIPHLNLDFLRRQPSMMFPAEGGLQSALFGTFWLILMTAFISVPMGVGTAVYLEEYAGDSRFTRFIRLNIANLAGVPSIVYGILGLTVFVTWFRFGLSVLSGSLTLSLLILPVVIIATRESLAAVPQSIRAAAFALGATRWQTVRAHVLPAALPGIMTGVILALSRAIGEAAPLAVLGIASQILTAPDRVTDEFVAMPLQIFFWAKQPQPEFHVLAAAGIIVLLTMLLTMNAVAVGIRAWHQRNKHW